MVAELDDDQLAAVVAHERAHLAEHHHLLLLPFVAWEAALPVLPAAARAHASVRQLVEMRADDVALRLLPHGSRRTLAQAIVAVAGGAAGVVPAGALSVVGSAVGVRVLRLLEPPSPLPAAARWGALAAALLLLLVPTLLLVLPAFL
jgi:beta-lactamase regulating signal transducer with metallopeptidase domain